MPSYSPLARPNRPPKTDASRPPLMWWQGWAPMLVLPCAAFVLIPSDWPRWIFMWALAFAIYCGCKWLTWRRTPVDRVPLWKHAGYLLAWPGLDAAAFLKPPPPSLRLRPRPGEWAFALTKLLLGVGLLYGIARLIPPRYPYLIGWTGMIGLVMTLHFGLFQLLSASWRSLDVNARPLMEWPLASTSLSEFWGRRWNTAFRDLTHRFLFRPLNARLGPARAILVVFLVSGLVHELVISVPARGGYGGPTAFFGLQVLALLVGRSAAGKRVGLGNGRTGWLFTILVLVSPAWILFHPPFVLEVVVPFMNAMGAI